MYIVSTYHHFAVITGRLLAGPSPQANGFVVEVTVNNTEDERRTGTRCEERRGKEERVKRSSGSACMCVQADLYSRVTLTLWAWSHCVSGTVVHGGLLCLVKE